MTIRRKGIILAGGNGSRLFPITLGVSKQLLPIYDKPMIYYPITTLMLAGIREILLITTPYDIQAFERLIGDGSQWGISIKYAIQKRPSGLAEAFLIGEKFLQNHPVTLILGDNLFYGSELITQLQKANKQKKGATIFAYPVLDPERYGVIDFDKHGKVTSIEEKPSAPKSKYVVTGIYFYDQSISEKASTISPSDRGELEITDINLMYLNEKTLNLELMGRGMAWFDTGTFDSLHEAGSFIRTIENRQGLKIGCPEEIAWRNGWINNKNLEQLAEKSLKSGYGEYLLLLLDDSSRR